MLGYEIDGKLLWIKLSELDFSIRNLSDPAASDAMNTNLCFYT